MRPSLCTVLLCMVFGLCEGQLELVVCGINVSVLFFPVIEIMNLIPYILSFASWILIYDEEFVTTLGLILPTNAFVCNEILTSS